MNKYLISYYYLASGMEGRADQYPQTRISAPNEDMAIYLYLVIYFDSYKSITFNEYMKKDEVYRRWGIHLIKLNSDGGYVEIKH